jgi:restriction system protein
MIPDYQTLMLAMLEYVKDGKEYPISDCIDFLAEKFHLTEEELEQWLPSKKQKTFYNRVYWAKAHLKMAGTLENTRRGFFKITAKGLSVLSENPDTVNVKYLMSKFPDYGEMINGYRKTDTVKSVDIPQNISLVETPEEQIESGYQKIRQSLEQEILSKLKAVNPYFFERIVVELLVKMGYGGSIQDAGKAIGKSGDEGIDGIIKEDKLGLDVIYIQAKRWENVVGRPEVQKFVGALAGQRAKKGVFITTSYYTKDATEYALQMDTKVVLIDGEKLAQYMIDYNLGVSTQNTYEIKKIDSDYFEED